MRTQRTIEAHAQDLSDIEDGDVKPNCFNCGKKQLKQVKIITTVDSLGIEHKTRTRTFLGACTNPECFRAGDLNQSPSWVSAK